MNELKRRFKNYDEKIAYWKGEIAIEDRLDGSTLKQIATKLGVGPYKANSLIEEAIAEDDFLYDYYRGERSDSLSVSYFLGIPIDPEWIYVAPCLTGSAVVLEDGSMKWVPRISEDKTKDIVMKKKSGKGKGGKGKGKGC